MLFGLPTEIILAIIAACAAGWGMARSGSVAGWRSVADARKERIVEIEAALARAEQREASLAQKVAELEARGDVTAVIERIDRLGQCVDELKEAVHEFSARWG